MHDKNVPVSLLLLSVNHQTLYKQTKLISEMLWKESYSQEADYV